MDHLLTKFDIHQTNFFLAINVLVTSLQAISDPKVTIACESIKGKQLNGNAYVTGNVETQAVCKLTGLVQAVDCLE